MGLSCVRKLGLKYMWEHLWLTVHHLRGVVEVTYHAGRLPYLQYHVTWGGLRLQAVSVCSPGNSRCKWMRFCDRMLRFCILLDHVCLQESLDLIEVSWVNVVYLIHTSSLWLCEVKSSCCLAPSSPCPEWLHSGVDKAWNGGRRIGYSRQGTFSAVKGTHRFPFQSKQCHKPFVPLLPFIVLH